MKKVGVVGLGSIGAGSAFNLLKKGFEVTVYDVRPEPIDAAVSAGATAASTPAELGARSEIVIVFVLNAKQVEQVCYGREGLLEGMKPGSVLVLSPTIAPEDARKVAAAAAGKAIEFLDAPVSGGKNGANSGTLTLMVGGSRLTFEKARHVFEAIGRYIVHVGDEVGSGLIVKAVNQVITHTSVVALAEGLVFGAKAGIDPDVLFDVLTRCTANSYMWQDRVPDILRRDFTMRGSLDIQVKDLGICLEMGQAMKLPMYISAAAQQVYLMGQAEGYGPQDLGAVVKVYEKYANVEVKGSGTRVAQHQVFPLPS